MRLEIPQDKLNSFREAYIETVKLFGEPTGSTFKDSIVKALCAIAVGEQSSHSWLKSDGNGGAIFDSKRRNEDWIESMLTQVFEEYDIDSINAHRVFTESEEYQNTVEVLSRYYSTTGYFSKFVRAHREGKRLRSNEYQRMCGNKYAKKVLVAHNAEPKFPLGTLVDFRAQHNETSDVDGRVCYKRAPLGLLVLSNTEPILSAAVGAKRYKVAPVGDNGSPFYVEERYLKKRKKRK